METLERIWADTSDEGIPFSPYVNEAHVLDALEELSDRCLINDAIRSRTRQWVRWNRHINEYETEPYTTWVEQIYSRIESVLTRSPRSILYHNYDSTNVEETNGGSVAPSDARSS